MKPIIWVCLSLVCFTAGEAISKLWANGRHVYWSWWVGACIVAYALGSLCWLPAIREKNHLASLGSLWNAGAMVATVLVGAGLFHESVTVKQWVGIALGLCACFLLG